MSRLIGKTFRKMNGLGNDFVILDLRADNYRLTETEAQKIASRARGIGCDQVITIEKPRKSAGTAIAFMGIKNADGSPAGACGNAARCVASILFEETGKDRVEFETPSTSIRAHAVRDLIAVDMGRPKFNWQDIPLTEQTDDTRFVDIKLGPIDAPVLWGPSAVNVGNPHCVFFVDDAEAQALDKFGPMIENHPIFPDRANVSVAEVRSQHSIRLRVWERGAGITKACGTAACAALVCASRRRLSARKATITLDGGDLAIEWRENDHIIMTGPVAHEFDGTLRAEIF